MIPASSWQRPPNSVKMIAIIAFERRVLLRKALCTLLTITCLSVLGLPQSEHSRPGENTLSLAERLEPTTARR